MNTDSSRDFINLQICSTDLARMLGATPHLLTDFFGNTISSFSPEKTDASVLDIAVKGQAVAKLRAPANQKDFLKNMIEGALAAYAKASEAVEQTEEAQLISQDIESLLSLSENEVLPLQDLLFQLLRLIRSHSWVEKAGFFIMLDGFSMEGVAAAGWNGDTWKTLLSPLVGVVASTRLPYFVENPANDKHLKGRAGAEEIKNIACFPLIHGKNLLGVLTLTNRVGAGFDAKSKELPCGKFLNISAHLIQKHLLKTRMDESERTNDHLGKYLSKKVKKNVEDTQELQLGGVEKKVVCLFSDIRGYTTITEGISPGTLVKLLNFHFERMHAIIEKNEGTLDKIVGDLIMAVWNIPKDQPEPELLAMKAALEMQKEMIRTVIPEWRKQGVSKVGMGIGVNSGLAIAGNLGSTRFMNYTVIGDAVNTAQRLEAKAQAGEIWMNEEMYPAMHGKLEKPIRRELEIRLKGKEQTINALVYKPLHY